MAFVYASAWFYVSAQSEAEYGVCRLVSVIGRLPALI